MLYKILNANLKSGHGGDFNWENWLGKPTPNIWPVKMCISGYHVTKNPMAHPIMGMRVFEVIATGRGKYNAREEIGVYETITLGAERPDLVPDWWHEVERFVDGLVTMPLLQGGGEIDPLWRMFETAHDAWMETRCSREEIGGIPIEAAWRALRGVSRKAGRIEAWDKALRIASKAATDRNFNVALAIMPGLERDACLMVSALVLSDIQRAHEYLEVAQRHWDVWRRGYGLYSDVGGVFYVYRKV